MQRHAEDPASLSDLWPRVAHWWSFAGRGRRDSCPRSDGKEIIIVETVGIGQQEIDIIDHAHSVIVVLVPGMGDEIQTMKAGLMEIADIFVINKADARSQAIAYRINGDAQFSAGRSCRIIGVRQLS